MTVGQAVSYHMGGWRYGVIRELDPERGRHAGQILIAHPVTGDIWIPTYDVNELGDTTYHGPKSYEVVEARKDAKAEQQAKANRQREKARRFHK